MLLRVSCSIVLVLDRQRTEERKQMEDIREMERKRKHLGAFKVIQLDTHFDLVF